MNTYVDMDKITKGLKYDLSTDKVVFDTGQIRGNEVDKSVWYRRLIDNGIDVDDFKIIKDKCIEYLKDKEIAKTNKEQKVNDIDYLQIAKDSGAFDPYVLVTNTETKNAMIFCKVGTNLQIVCTASEFTGSVFYKFNSGRLMEDLTEKLIQAYKKVVPKKLGARWPEDEMICHEIKSRVHNKDLLKIVSIRGDLHPAVIETSKVPALNTIPFYYENVTFEDLNPYLKEVLLRITDHEYLCAIIGGYVQGKHFPYLIYLYGAGQDSKTSFIKMLGRLLGSIGEYKDDNQFSNLSMYGYPIIAIWENNDPRLFKDKKIKKITGGSVVSLEGKGTAAYNGRILGLFISDSNNKPKVSGELSELRRLRYHEIAKANITSDGIIAQDRFIDMLNSTPNKFLNYCIQQWDKLKNKEGDEVTFPKNNREVLSSLKDLSLDYEFSQFLKIDMPLIKIRPGLKFPVGELLSKLQNKVKNVKFAANEFTTWLAIEHGVKQEGAYFIGIGYEPMTKIEFKSNKDDEVIDYEGL